MDPKVRSCKVNVMVLKPTVFVTFSEAVPAKGVETTGRRNREFPLILGVEMTTVGGVVS